MLLKQMWLPITAFTIGMAVGGWGVNKLYNIGEVRALNATIEQMGRNYQADMNAIEARHKKDVARVSERVKVREVIKYVKDDVNCDIPPAVVRVLDARMQGQPLDGDARGSEDSTSFVGVSESQSLAALDDIAERFHACRDLIIEHNVKVSARQ